MTYDFKGKTALVTGASEGIGLAVARRLGAAGALVALVARSEEKLKKAVAGIPGAAALRADLRRPEERKALVDAVLSKYGRLDILVNNAGQGIYGPLEKVPLTAYREVMELNLFAVVDLMQQVIPPMRAAGGGRIVNVSSMVSKNYFPGLSAYASTKYALNAVSFTSRRELEKDGIIVSVMHPRMTATRFGVNAVGGDPADSRADGRPAPGVDTADQVAARVMELIASGAAEASM